VTIAFYMCTYLLVGLGPAPTTFLVPSLLFSSSFRSTANGLAAACGKLGAVVAVITVGYAGFDIAALMAYFGAIGVLGVASTLFTIRAHMRSETSHYSINSNSGGINPGGIQRSEYMQIPNSNDADIDEENERIFDESGNSNNSLHKNETQEIRGSSGLIPENKNSNTFIQSKLPPASMISPLSSFASNNVNHRGDKYLYESKFPVKKSSFDESLIREKL